MATKIKPCTSHNGRHSWEWQKDVTFKRMTITGAGSTVQLSRRGKFICRCCPEIRYGKARSGL